MERNDLRRRLARAALAAVLAGAVGASGCVRSKVVVTSEPPGADVHMNDVHLGRTPIEMPFTWYWYYDFKAELDGHRTGIRRERFRAPVWLWPPADLLMEAMPFTVKDTKYVHFELQPEPVVPAPEYAGTE